MSSDSKLKPKQQSTVQNLLDIENIQLENYKKLKAKPLDAIDNMNQCALKDCLFSYKVE